MPKPNTYGEEKQNGARLSGTLINKGTPALRGAFMSLVQNSCFPTLTALLNDPLVNSLLWDYFYGTNTAGRGEKPKILNQAQCDLLYPPSGANVDPSTFDLTLLSFLLLEILPEIVGEVIPYTYTSSYKQMIKDIVKLRKIRNQCYGHITTTEISKVDFENKWTILECILIKFSVPQTDIDKCKNEYLQPDVIQKFQEQLQAMRDNDLLFRLNTNDHLAYLTSAVEENTKSIKRKLEEDHAAACSQEKLHKVPKNQKTESKPAFKIDDYRWPSTKQWVTTTDCDGVGNDQCQYWILQYPPNPGNNKYSLICKHSETNIQFHRMKFLRTKRGKMKDDTFMSTPKDIVFVSELETINNITCVVRDIGTRCAETNLCDVLAEETNNICNNEENKLLVTLQNLDTLSQLNVEQREETDFTALMTPGEEQQWVLIHSDDRIVIQEEANPVMLKKTKAVLFTLQNQSSNIVSTLCSLECKITGSLVRELYAQSFLLEENKTSILSEEILLDCVETLIGCLTKKCESTEEFNEFVKILKRKIETFVLGCYLDFMYKKYESLQTSHTETSATKETISIQIEETEYKQDGTIKIETVEENSDEHEFVKNRPDDYGDEVVKNNGKVKDTRPGSIEIDVTMYSKWELANLKRDIKYGIYAKRHCLWLKKLGKPIPLGPINVKFIEYGNIVSESTFNVAEIFEAEEKELKNIREFLSQEKKESDKIDEYEEAQMEITSATTEATSSQMEPTSATTEVTSLQMETISATTEIDKPFMEVVPIEWTSNECTSAPTKTQSMENVYTDRIVKLVGKKQKTEKDEEPRLEGMKPKVTFQHHERTEDFNLSLMCHFEVVKAPTIHWYRNGKTLRKSSTVHIDSGDSYSKLIINGDQITEAETFVCVVENSVGEDTAEFVIEPTGEALPVIMSKRDEYSFSTHEKAILRCVFDSKGKDYDIKWLKDNAMLIANDKYDIQVIESTTKLTLNDARVEDSGCYKCVITNTLGRAHIEIKCTVMDNSATSKVAHEAGTSVQDDDYYPLYRRRKCSNDDRQRRRDEYLFLSRIINQNEALSSMIGCIYNNELEDTIYISISKKFEENMPQIQEDLQTMLEQKQQEEKDVTLQWENLKFQVHEEIFPEFLGKKILPCLGPGSAFTDCPNLTGPAATDYSAEKIFMYKGYGTIGCIAMDMSKKKYIVSVKHVVSKAGDTAIDTEPKSIISGKTEKLIDQHPEICVKLDYCFVMSGNFKGFLGERNGKIIDIGIYGPIKDSLTLCLENENENMIDIYRDEYAALKGRFVTKQGAATGATEGYIIVADYEINFELKDKYGNEGNVRGHCFLVTSYDNSKGEPMKSSDFSVKGDSGALIVLKQAHRDEPLQAVGLVQALNPKTIKLGNGEEYENVTVGVYLKDCLSAIKEENLELHYSYLKPKHSPFLTYPVNDDVMDG